MSANTNLAVYMINPNTLINLENIAPTYSLTNKWESFGTVSLYAYKYVL